jgi:hypothetical protein
MLNLLLLLSLGGPMRRSGFVSTVPAPEGFEDEDFFVNEIEEDIHCE